MGDLVKGPEIWTENARKQAGAEVVHLFAGSGADDVLFDPPDGVKPRPHHWPKFADLAGGFGSLREALRPEDRAEADRVKAAARAAREVYEGDGLSAHICPSLLVALAGRAHGIADSCKALARELESLKRVPDALSFLNLADKIETIAARIEAPAHPEGA